MIPVSVVPPGRADPRLLDVPGAFVWWYVDLVDGNGDGLVLIASWGLPFIPGLLDAARRGRPEAPRGWPALSLAVYRGGSCSFYLLDVPSDASWAQVGDCEVLTLGASTVSIGYAEGALDVVADIDAEGAGQRITGQIRVRGASPPWSEPADAVHGWSVLAACALGEAQLSTEAGEIRITGRAYVDRNAGTRPIDALGMSAWTWARVAFPDRELVVWDVDGETAGEQQIALTVDAEGARTVVEAVIARTGRRWIGAPRALVVGDVTLSIGAALEWSPFYARFPVTATSSDGRTGRGFAERCVPHRIDARWMRPLVSMAVQRPQARSRWLPLFAGPREGRVRRLLRSWVAA